MTRKMKAILVLFFAAEIVNSAKVGVLKGRIADLETQRDIYASRAQNWLDRAVEDEEVIDSLQIRLDETADRKIELTEAGTFFCTAYCTEQYEHICGEGHGITASGQPIQAGVTVAADTSIFPYGTVLYIEGVGIFSRSRNSSTRPAPARKKSWQAPLRRKRTICEKVDGI